MAFQVKDYHDLVQLLWQRPEWREELRQLLLTPEILTLPAVVRELAEAQKRTEQRVEELAQAQKRTEQRVEELAEAQRQLAEAQKRTEQRVEELAQAQKRTEQRVEELAQAQKRTEQRVEELAQAQEKTEKQVQRLTAQVNALTGEMGNVRGELLEIRYRQQPFSFFGQLVSQVRAVDLQDIWDTLEEHLSEEELNELLALDILLQGRARRSLEPRLGRSEIWLAVEISSVVDARDVERARFRADLLRKAGLPVLAIAAGRGQTKGAGETAKKLGVIVQTDGRLDYLAEALAG